MLQTVAWARIPASDMKVINCKPARRRGGRVAEGGGLLNRYTGQNLYRGFESLPLRHSLDCREFPSRFTQKVAKYGHFSLTNPHDYHNHSL